MPKKLNRLLYLTAMSTKSRGLHEYILHYENGGKEHPNAMPDFTRGRWTERKASFGLNDQY